MNPMWKMMLLANSKDKEDDYTGYGDRDYYDGMKRNRHRDVEKKQEFGKSVIEKWVKSMENADGTNGGHWTYEQTEIVREQRDCDCDPDEFYAVMNMMYSDYYSVADKHGVNNANFYADLTEAFLNDEDAVDDKVERYYECVVK